VRLTEKVMEIEMPRERLMGKERVRPIVKWMG
jgi:hypothetical protein